MWLAPGKFVNGKVQGAEETKKSYVFAWGGLNGGKRGGGGGLWKVFMHAERKGARRGGRFS